MHPGLNCVYEWRNLPWDDCSIRFTFEDYPIIVIQSWSIVMAQINPHINFNGNCEEAFEFYRSVFGGSFARIMRFSDLPDAGGMFSDAEAAKIMHISLPIGANALIGNDVPEIMGRVNEQEQRSKISITAASRDEARRLFNGLSDGGQVEVGNEGDDNADAFFAMFRDRWGIEWIVDFFPPSPGS